MTISVRTRGRRMRYVCESSDKDRSTNISGVCVCVSVCLKSLSSNSGRMLPPLLQTSASVAEHHGRPNLSPSRGALAAFTHTHTHTHLTEEGSRNPSAQDSTAQALHLYSGGTCGCWWLFLGGPGAASSGKGFQSRLKITAVELHIFPKVKSDQVHCQCDIEQGRKDNTRDLNSWLCD